MMILRRLRVINRNQRGFTLAEMLVAMAISALIGSAVAGATYQVVNINATSTNHQIVIDQVQNAVNSVSRDAEQAQYITRTDGGGALLPNVAGVNSFDLVTTNKIIFEWTEWDNTLKEITYVVVNGRLQRGLKVNGVLTSTTYVASNISIASGTWNTSTKVLTVTIESQITAPKLATETRTFQIMPRPAK